MSLSEARRGRLGFKLVVLGLVVLGMNFLKCHTANDLQRTKSSELRKSMSWQDVNDQASVFFDSHYEDKLVTGWWSGVGSFCGSLAAQRFLDLGETRNARLVDVCFSSRVVRFLNGNLIPNIVSCIFMYHLAI